MQSREPETPKEEDVKPRGGNVTCCIHRRV